MSKQGLIFQNDNGSDYFIITGNDDRALLRDMDTGGYVIARSLDWTHKCWGGGSYFSATYICGLLDKGGVFKIDVQKQLLIKELRKYLDRAEKDDTTYCELLMEIPELLETFNCGLN